MTFLPIVDRINDDLQSRPAVARRLAPNLNLERDEFPARRPAQVSVQGRLRTLWQDGPPNSPRRALDSRTGGVE